MNANPGANQSANRAKPDNRHSANRGATHSVRLCHLYPREMNIYADRGNLAVLARRLAWRSITLDITPSFMGEPLADTNFDLIYMGGGQDNDQAIIARDLLANKAGAVSEALAGHAAGLFVCGGYQLAGKTYHTQQHGQLDGLGVLDITTAAGDSRLIGDIVVEVDGLGAGAGGPGAGLGAGTQLRGIQIVGYENHLGRTHLGPDAEPLGKVICGHGNNGSDRTEGAVRDRIIGTYLHGPLLPRNPQLADLILTWALSHRYGSEVAAELLGPTDSNPSGNPSSNLDDTWERAAHAVGIKRAKMSRLKRGRKIT